MKRIFSLLLLSFFLIFLASASSFASELDEVKAAIKEKGAKWTAGENSVSKLPQEMKKLRVGLIHPKETGTEALISAPAVSALAGSLDWRAILNSEQIPENYVTPVRDQGNCGSCWAFAATAGLESLTVFKNKIPISATNPDFDTAEQVLISCSKAGSCGGGYIDRASSFLRDTGIPLETCYYYTATNGNCKRACNAWKSDAYRIGSWAYVAITSPTVNSIKNALTTYGPLVTTMNVYSDFFLYTSGVYSYATGRLQGGHAILIIGYDDAEQCFIVKNSWGIGWGEGGFFKIAYSQLTSPVKFGWYTIAYMP